MRGGLKGFLFLLSGLITIHGAYAQILDDDNVPSSSNSIILDDEGDDEEEVFNELFSDHEETERDITKMKTFNDVLDVSAELLKQKGVTEPEEETAPQEPVTPLEGELQIGISTGSFRIYKNTFGKSSCLFGVTVKSTFNKKIKTMAVNLIYPMRNFAFVFRNIPENGSEERFIRTSGDICYNINGAPDIYINKCKIYGADGTECAERIKWVEDIVPPDTKERKYFFYK